MWGSHDTSKQRAQPNTSLTVSLGNAIDLKEYIRVYAIVFKKKADVLQSKCKDFWGNVRFMSKHTFCKQTLMSPFHTAS